MSLRVGVHLPQYGRAAGPEAVTRAARQADDLGFDDVWVSDHLAVPADAPYPPAFLYEPVVTLTWAAAATSTIGLGTSVLVLPYRHPLHLAKELASLDQLSGGRLVVGAAAGWLRDEFAALGVPFERRGPLTDQAIDALRACWDGDGPVSFHGDTVHFDAMRVVPRPAHRIPIWVGGTSDAAMDRAATRGDGWHANVPDAAALEPLVLAMRRRRPEEDFTISTRTGWDGARMSASDIRREAEALMAAGVQHVVAAPAQNDLDAWLASVEALSQALLPLR